MELSSILESQVPLSTRTKGRDYFQRGLVDFDEFNKTEVLATVQGSEGYDVDLDLDGAKLYVRCTCPYVEENQEVCKHIWATILAAQKRGFAANTHGRHLKIVLTNLDEGEDEPIDDWDEDGDDDIPSPTYSPRYTPHYPVVRQREKRETWKDHLETLSRELQPKIIQTVSLQQMVERRLIYIVDTAASEQARKLVVELSVQERKKNGEWSKPKGQSYSSSQSQNDADPLDRQILAMLGGAERGESYGFYNNNYYSYSLTRFRIDGPLLDTLLPLLASTGRVRLRQSTIQPAVVEDTVPDLDPPWQLTIGVNRNSTGKHWVLGGSLKRGDRTMAISEAKLIVPGVVFWDGCFSRLNDGGAFAWVPILRRVGNISVPIAKADELLGQLLQMPHLPKFELPEELRYSEEAVQPRPRLTVKASKTYYGKNDLHASLSFDYGGQIVKLQDSGRGLFRPESKTFVLRDLECERAALQRIRGLGASTAWSAGEQVLQIKPNQLPKIVRLLVVENWLVEAEGKLYRQPGEFKLDIHSERDWFDLSATVSFEGQKAPLPRLLAALKRNENSIVLDDGSLGMVPEEWMKKYGLIARMGTIEGDQIRFSRTQIGVLDALLASRPDVTFDKQFAIARDRLKQFEGVASAEPPPEFKGELRGYQHEGLGWLQFLRSFGFGGCLADDMGLGKTVQVLALFSGKLDGPVLVVVPRSLVFNWKQEAARFVPGLKVLDHTGTTRDKTGATFKGYDLIVTTYGTLRNDAAIFSEIRFDTCVLDESQAAKNAETETAKAVRLINADHRLALSGTPVENHLGELWTLFDFLNPGMLGRGIFVGSAGSLRNPDPETREVLAKALRPFILRRTKDQVAKDLPAKTEQTVYCDLEADQRELYDELREHYRMSLLAKVDSVGLGKSKIQILEALLRLRQAACHPGLIDKKRTKESSAKLDLLLPQLEEIVESGCKALVFSQFTSLLSILRTRLDAKKVPYEYLDGRTRDRAARVKRFQTDPDCRLFLVSLKAGGVGLNLTAAEYVFLLDPWWNPAVEAQAIDRSHRIGQTKPVFAYRLIARGTVEEKVLALQKSKRELADAILGGDGRLITDLKREDLELLLS